MSGQMFPIYSLQWASLNTVPAPHAHVLKHDRWFKRPVYLTENLMGTGRNGRTFTALRVALIRITFIIIHHGKWLFWLELHNSSFTFFTQNKHDLTFLKLQYVLSSPEYFVDQPKSVYWVKKPSARLVRQHTNTHRLPLFTLEKSSQWIIWRFVDPCVKF